jgi:hypothetical protein
MCRHFISRSRTLKCKLDFCTYLLFVPSQNDFPIIGSKSILLFQTDSVKDSKNFYLRLRFSNSKAVGKTESSFIPALLISGTLPETVSNVLKIPYNFLPLVLG